MLNTDLINLPINTLGWDISKLTNIKKLGGLNNINYKITYNNEDYFFRLCNNNMFKINSDLELEIIHKASTINLCYNPIYFDTTTGTMVTKFIKGSTPTEEESNSFEVINLLSKKVKELHKLQCKNYFNPFNEIKNRLAICKKHHLPLPKNIDILINHISLLENELSSSLEIGLCHNDLNPSNVIINENDLFIIDYEYAAMGDIFFDLATISWLIKESNYKVLLTEYFGYYSEAHHNKLIRYLFVVKFLNATWSLIKSLDATPSSYDYLSGSNLIFDDLIRSIN